MCYGGYVGARRLEFDGFPRLSAPGKLEMCKHMLHVCLPITHMQPVCNEEGDIFGLLDITRCLYEALNKMERAYESSRKLYDALEGVEREWARNSPAQFVQYMDALRDNMSCPDLTTVLDDVHPVVQVSVKAAVRDVAKLMKEYRTTAVLVMDHGGLAGIFTVNWHLGGMGCM